MIAARAHLPRGRLGAERERLSAVLERIMAAFAGAGAEVVEPAALLPAETLLDLYGEDIRARAYVTQDPVAGEMMLRPDFTVPVVGLHMAHGATPARYAYAGPVWRAQEPGSARPNEYLQAGIELFGGEAAEADAEVFALVAGLLCGYPARPLTGDMGVLAAMVDGLDTAPHRRAALRRHLWRPVRFRRLLERFGASHDAAAGGRRDLIAALREGRLGALIAAGGEPVGLRRAEEVAERVVRLAEEAETPPLSAEQVALMETVLDVAGPMGSVLARLADLASEASGLPGAITRIERRMEALARRGIAAADLPFRASFGRTTLEYYDGFVFGFEVPARPDLPPLASGGRYDGLTAVLGRGKGIPAVGAILRPEAMVAAEGGA